MAHYPDEGMPFHTTRITQVRATIEQLLGIPAPEDPRIAPPIPEVLDAAEKSFSIQRADRVFMYNPDAIAHWIFEKYKDAFAPMLSKVSLHQPMLSVVPPVTPVCFSSMYSGLMPEDHGITKYEKPVLKVNTIFDEIPKAGKRAAIVSTEGDSISEVFKERDIDYYIYPKKEQCNEKAFELIDKDAYDLIVLYNGDYDYWMHRNSPTGSIAIRHLEENIDTYCQLVDAISEKWKSHHTALAFAQDHGCHRAYGFLGNHGIEEPCDMNIDHFWTMI